MADQQSVLILGGGFAGWYAARYLASMLPRTASITVVDRVDHMLYTPMLTEVAGGTVSQQAVAVSQQRTPARVQWVNAQIVSVDAASRSATLADGSTLSAAHLVIALGAVTSYHKIPGAEENSIPLKTLAHANEARERVDAMIGEAAELPQGESRRNKLTFLVAGGGYTGVETMAALYARMRKRAAEKQIHPSEIQAILVEPMERLMQEMPEPLAVFGKKVLEKDGVRVLTGVGVSKVEKGRVTLANGEELSPALLIWDTGIEPNPLIKDAGVPLGKHHGVVVDSTMKVQGMDRVWALGDCAEIPNELDGKTYAPTAQNAVREAKQLARNIASEMKSRKTRPFRYKMLGQLALISEHSAVANVLGIQIKGLLAWGMWWIIYIAKLPGVRNRLQVVRNLLGTGASR